MNPYAQLSGPQNNAYPSFQGQSNKYPTLPTSQDSQYQHPFPTHQYSQPNQYYPYGNAQTGFFPPSGPGNIQNLPPKAENAESLLNEARIKQLDEGLNTFFICFYRIWLWVSIIGFAIGGARSFLMLTVITDETIRLASLGIYCFWNVIQCAIELLAISQKDLAKAKIACWMMSGFVVPAVLTGIWLIGCIINYVPDLSDPFYYLWYVVMYMYLSLDIFVVLTHVLICLNGAFIVRKILQERKLIDERFNRSDDSFQA